MSRKNKKNANSYKLKKYNNTTCILIVVYSSLLRKIYTYIFLFKETEISTITIVSICIRIHLFEREKSI